MMKLPNTAHIEEMPAAIGRIGRFYLVRELGSGSIGTVYLARDPIIDRDVAIKTFNRRSMTGEKKQRDQHLINEARAAGRLAHPNIVTIYEASSEGGTTYIAMEYLQGCELNKLLDKGHQFSADDVASILWKVADALAYAHDHDVIHRDIKPANIFLIADHQPKIVDFGIARAPNRLHDQPGHIEQPFTLFQNNLLGTPNYMSPEQALGKQVDNRTDIYSLGAVMYEMLTGQKPFQRASTDELLHTIAYKSPPSPHELNTSIPLVLSQIAMKAMSKRPERRYQHAAEMALDLKRFVRRERRAKDRESGSALEMKPTIVSSRAAADKPNIFLLALLAIAVIVFMLYSLWIHN
jgi:serine/threonine protein kinase